MLLIQEYNRDHNHRVLAHGPDVFHKALKWVLAGETVFHVTNPKGEDYNLAYVNNQTWAEQSPDYPDSPLFRQEPLCPPYVLYDEHATERLCLDVLEGFSTVWLEEANEYTVVLAGILLRETELGVITPDPRFAWFYAPGARMTIDRQASRPAAEDVMKVQKDYYPSGFTCDFATMDQVSLFHNVFVYQWLTDLPPDQIRYAQITIARSEGIGSILAIYSRAKDFFSHYGWEVTLQPGTARYSDALIEKYFNIRLTPENADDTNTVWITNYYGILFTKMLRFNNGHNDFDRSSLNPRFLAEMQEYASAVLGDKKWLGLLMRGSDYIASGMSGTSAPVSVDTALPKIREWMDEGHYDGIFLATEDRDILRQLFDAFPGKIRVVAQERYSVSDFMEAGVTTISELDRKRHSAEEYDAYVEDSTVNYFYALYLLSCCDAFMYSCDCGGITLARSLSSKGFSRQWCFAEDQ